jgi:hypothetical protein
MVFSEQVKQLFAGMSAEQAVSLRALIVHLTERTEANCGVLNTGLRSLMLEYCNAYASVLQVVDPGSVNFRRA